MTIIITCQRRKRCSCTPPTSPLTILPPPGSPSNAINLRLGETWSCFVHRFDLLVPTLLFLQLRLHLWKTECKSSATVSRLSKYRVIFVVFPSKLQLASFYFFRCKNTIVSNCKLPPTRICLPLSGEAPPSSFVFVVSVFVFVFKCFCICLKCIHICVSPTEWRGPSLLFCI